MKTIEILYQAFRVRYSLNQLQTLLDRGCRVALLGPGEAVDIMKSFLGDPVPGLKGEDPAEDLVELSWDLGDADIKELRTCDACLVLFEDGPPEEDALKELAEKIPIHVKTMWMCLSDHPKGGTYHEKDLTLPTIQALPKGKAREKFLKLLIVGLPQIVVILARNWTNVRSQFCKTITRRTALRNGIRSGISALPLSSVPVIGPALSLLAISAETMMLTASQLRLSFVIAAAHNRPLDFFDRISELWPIVGGAYGLRGMSRTLIKMLPKAAPGLKASIAFSGTYAIGEASRLYYEYGQPTNDEVRRELVRRSHEEGAKEAQRLFRRVLAGQSLEDIEAEETGAEVEELLDDLTALPNEPVGDPSAEPTVEMEAVAAVPEEPQAAPSDKEAASEPKESPSEAKSESKSGSKSEPKAKTEPEPEPEKKEKAKSETDSKKSSKKKRSRSRKKKDPDSKSKSGDQDSKEKKSSKSKKKRKSKKKKS